MVGQKKQKRLVTAFYDIKYKTALPKMDDSQRFAYICFWSTTLLKTQYYGIYQSNQTKQNMAPQKRILLSVEKVWVNLLKWQNCPQHNLLRFVKEWPIFTLGSTLKSPDSGQGFRSTMSMTILRDIFFLSREPRY